MGSSGINNMRQVVPLLICILSLLSFVKSVDDSCSHGTCTVTDDDGEKHEGYKCTFSILTGCIHCGWLKEYDCNSCDCYFGIKALGILIGVIVVATCCCIGCICLCKQCCCPKKRGVAS